MSPSGRVLQSSRVLQERLFVHLWVHRSKTVLGSSASTEEAPYLLEFILINFTYIETSVMSRKGSFKERKIIFVSGSVDLKYCTRLGSMMPGSGGGFSARVMLLPKWGCGNSHNWKQSGSFNSWEKESNPHNPLYCLICFLSGHVKGP